MSEKKHIDRLFQEKFKDFEVSPDKNVWNNIERELKGKKPRRRVLIPIWYKIAGSAAMLAFLIWMGSGIFDNAPDKDKTNIATEVETNEVENTSEALNPETGNEEAEANFEENNSRENELISTEAVVTTENEQNNDQQVLENKVSVPKESYVKVLEKEEDFLSGKMASNRLEKSGQVEENTGLNPKSHFEKPVSVEKESQISKAEVFLESKPSEKPVKDKGEANKKSLLAYAEQQKKEENPDKESLESVLSQSKWQIQPFAAPVYYKGGNAIDPKFASNPTESDITMAYGVNVAYQISEKLKIRSGIGQVKISNNIQDIAFVSTVEPTALSNIDYNPQAETLRIENASTVFIPNGEVAGRGVVPFSAGTLNHQMGFIEVPLEIEYALIDKKFGLSIIGGGSTLFLSENNISINSAQGTTNIGEANNLNNTSFSTNIGLGLDYEITKRFELSLEPTFKYQLNTFSENVDFNPYYFGVFTGVSFKF
jgi:hypothetical protein